jgi:hypothetical protein
MEKPIKKSIFDLRVQLRWLLLMNASQGCCTLGYLT